MSLSDGMAAVNLEMPSRIPRVEFDAETHWELVSKVTGIGVDVESPEDVKTKATLTFIRSWNYDIKLEPLINEIELNAKRTCMDTLNTLQVESITTTTSIVPLKLQKRFSHSIPGKCMAPKTKVN